MSLSVGRLAGREYVGSIFDAHKWRLIGLDFGVLGNKLGRRIFVTVE